MIPGFTGLNDKSIALKTNTTTAAATTTTKTTARGMTILRLGIILCLALAVNPHRST